MFRGSQPAQASLSSQGEAFVSHTARTLWFRFFPRGCHARCAPPFSHLCVLTTLTGSFVALYRVILNTLPLLFPANIPLRESLRNLFSTLFSTQDEHDDFGLDDSPTSSSTPSPLRPQSLLLHISPGERREARLSSSAQAHQSWVRRKTRRWHSILAGAISGFIAVSFEKRSRQNVIAQQLFVRYDLLSCPVIQKPTFGQWVAGFIQCLLGETWFPYSTWRGHGFRACVRNTFFLRYVLISEKDADRLYMRSF